MMMKLTTSTELCRVVARRVRSAFRLVMALAALAMIAGVGAGCESGGGAGSSSDIREAAREHHGKLVIVGGGLRENNSDVYREFVLAALAEQRRDIAARPRLDPCGLYSEDERSRRSDKSDESADHTSGTLNDSQGMSVTVFPRIEWLRIVVVPTASGDPDGAARSASAAIRRAAMHADVKIETAMLRADRPESADDAEIAALIDGAHGVWFTGGDQSRVTRALRLNSVDAQADGGGRSESAGRSLDEHLGATAVGAAFARAQSRGAAIGGTSAGAAIMSDPMLAGGTSDRWLRSLWDAVDAGGDANSAVASGAVRLVPGVGFFEHALTDQHFLARGRLGRLVVATLADPRGLGIGIADDRAATVMQVKRSIDITVVRPIGAESVVLVDTRRAVVTPDGVRGVRVSLLSDDDLILFYSDRRDPMEVKLSNAKGFTIGRALGDGNPMPRSDDAFGLGSFAMDVPDYKIERREERAWESAAVLMAIRRLATTNRMQVLESDTARITLSTDQHTRFRFGDGWMHAATDVLLNIEAIRGGPIADDDDTDDDNER